MFFFDLARPFFFFFLKNTLKISESAHYVVRVAMQKVVTAELQFPASGHWQKGHRMGAGHKRPHIVGFHLWEMSVQNREMHRDSK